jgi:hypothetical protein
LPLLLAATAVLLGGWWATARYGLPEGVDFRALLQAGAIFAGRHELYWLFAPFILAGIYAAWAGLPGPEAPSPAKIGETPRSAPAAPGRPKQARQVLGPALLWALASLATGSQIMASVTSVVVFVFSALGLIWIAARFIKSDTSSSFLVPSSQFPVYLFLPLLLLNLLTLGQLYAVRPLDQMALQAQAAAWLRANSDPAALLFAPQRIAYLAGRPSIAAQVERLRDDNVGRMVAQLLGQTPDYVVAEGTPAWDYVTRTTWFKARYVPQAAFADDYAGRSPVTIWGYQPSPYDLGADVQTTAVIDDRLALVGYRFDPQVISPGDDIYLTLYMQALAPIETGFHTGVHLTAHDGWVWAWKETQLPRSLPGSWWEPGQVIAERYLLQTTADIPLGAYDLQVFWRDALNKTELPLFRDGDQQVLDRVHLGYVVAPPEVDAGQATAVNGQFGQEILLQGVKAEPRQPAAGEMLAVSLFWDALTRPQENYTVFVHFLNADGQLIASSDSMPVENRFPTGAFTPGIIVEDTHTLALPADLVPGVYELKVGLYLLETGERLPVWDAGGLEQGDRALKVFELSIE